MPYERRSTLRSETLADCYCNRFNLWACCQVRSHECYRDAKLDLIATILKHGDIPLSEVRRRLVCKVCGRRSYRIQIVPEGGLHAPQRELPVEARKKIIADAIARGTAAVNAARQELRDGKPMRF